VPRRQVRQAVLGILRREGLEQRQGALNGLRTLRRLTHQDPPARGTAPFEREAGTGP